MLLFLDPLGRRSLRTRFVFYLSAVVLITMISAGTIVCQEAYVRLLEEMGHRAKSLLAAVDKGVPPTATGDVICVARIDTGGAGVGLDVGGGTADGAALGKAKTLAGLPFEGFRFPAGMGLGPFPAQLGSTGTGAYGFMMRRSAASGGGYLVALCARSSVARPVQWLAVTLCWLTVLALAINVLLASVMAKRILAPFRQILEGMNRVMRGRYNVELAVHEEDEVGQFKSTFNFMQQQIKEKEFLERRLLYQDRMAFIGQLASGVAHEIRNPLASIFSLTQMMAQSASENPKIQEYAGVIAREVERLNRSVEELLTYAKPVPTEFKARRISEVVGDVVTLMSHEAKTRGTALVWNQNWDREVPLLIDGPKIGQVLINLIKNALEAIGKGGHISIALSYDEEDEKACIVVEDDGPGIPQDLRAHLFDPFFSTKQLGSGLGLAISAKIVAMHNGELRFDSEIHRGTRFSVVLPRLDEQTVAKLKDVA